MGRTVIVRLVTGARRRGQLVARLEDVETGAVQLVRGPAELVRALEVLADGAPPGAGEPPAR
jgi:hypothetical protein